MLNQNLWKKMKRGPQVVTLKDAGLISAYTGLQSGDLVVDAGAGSGFLAVYLGSIVSPKGKVVTYERRPEFAQLSKKNIETADMNGVVEVKEVDIFDGISEKEVDLITLDLAQPENLLDSAKEALKMEGFLVAYLPQVEQVKNLVIAAESKKIKHAQTIEVSVRNWLVRDYGVRPENVGIVFTGFLVFLKKVPEKDFEAEKEVQRNSKKGRRSSRIREKLSN